MNTKIKHVKESPETRLYNKLFAKLTDQLHDFANQCAAYCDTPIRSITFREPGYNGASRSIRIVTMSKSKPRPRKKKPDPWPSQSESSRFGRRSR